jgi:Zn ribbon nucleic-acid-binding protein
VHIAQPHDFRDLCSKSKDTDNRITTEPNGKLQQWQEAGLAKIEVIACRQLRRTVPQGVRNGTSSVSFKADSLKFTGIFG